MVGGIDPTALGAVLWFLRVRCAPSASAVVAEALARRTDTSWVSITSGGTEITCTVRTESEADSETLLLAKLPRTPRVEGVTAHSVLHAFYGGPDSLVAKLGSLDEAEVERLAAATGWSPTTVRRRMAELREHGVLYWDIDVDGRLFGLGSRTLLWLAVAPTQLEKAGTALAGPPRSRSPLLRPARRVRTPAWCARTSRSSTGI